MSGPSLEVCTDNATTEEMLWEMLVARQLYSSQSPADDQYHAVSAGPSTASIDKAHASTFFESRLGMLYHIEADDCPVAEVLLYAATQPRHVPQPKEPSGLATPPRSSSPLPSDHADSSPSHTPIRVFAQPLRSFQSLVSLIQTPPASPSSSQQDDCTFLSFPSHNSHSWTHQTDHHRSSDAIGPPAKRPRLDTVFAAARTASKRAQKRGGKSVAVAASSGLTRSYTTGSLPTQKVTSSVPGSRPADWLESKAASRPTSRPGTSSSASPAPHIALQRTQTHTRRTSLHRVASSTPFLVGGSEAALSPAVDSPLEPAPLSAPLLHPPPPSGTSRDTEDIAARNKTALSRVVLAALRMWGHSGGATASSSAPPAPDPGARQPRSDADAAANNPEDFKALYHATYSATKFALRHAAASHQLLAQDAMRGAVERVLELFLGQ